MFPIYKKGDHREGWQTRLFTSSYYITPLVHPNAKSALPEAAVLYVELKKVQCGGVCKIVSMV